MSLVKNKYEDKGNIVLEFFKKDDIENWLIKRFNLKKDIAELSACIIMDVTSVSKSMSKHTVTEEIARYAIIGAEEINGQQEITPQSIASATCKVLKAGTTLKYTNEFLAKRAAKK